MQDAATNFLYPLLTFSRKRLCFDGSPLCVSRSRSARGAPGRLSCEVKGRYPSPSTVVAGMKSDRRHWRYCGNSFRGPQAEMMRAVSA